METIKMAAYPQPLNLENIFVNNLAGSMEIFFFLAIILFAYLAARFRMPNNVFLIMMVIFVIFFSSFYPGLYAIVVLLVGLFAYYSISKLTQ